jgi:hypothetical protein
MIRLDFELKKIDNANVKVAASIDKTPQSIQNYRDRKYSPPLDVAIKITDFLIANGIKIQISDLLEEVDEQGQKIEAVTA